MRPQVGATPQSTDAPCASSPPPSPPRGFDKQQVRLELVEVPLHLSDREVQQLAVWGKAGLREFVYNGGNAQFRQTARRRRPARRMPSPGNACSWQLSEGWRRGRAGWPCAVPTPLPVTNQAGQFPGGAKQPLDRTRGQQQGAKPEGYRLLQLGGPRRGGLRLALCRRALCLETGAQILRLHQCPNQFGVLRGAR